MDNPAMGACLHAIANGSVAQQSASQDQTLWVDAFGAKPVFPTMI
jgi:hypothetical protein